jgi:hypothetical protein
LWRYIQIVPIPDQCGAVYRKYQYQITVKLYTGSTSTRSMWSYIQEVPVPDQCGAIYRKYQYQINVQSYKVFEVDTVPCKSIHPPWRIQGYWLVEVICKVTMHR